jgi:hypothetical protein
MASVMQERLVGPSGVCLGRCSVRHDLQVGIPPPIGADKEKKKRQLRRAQKLRPQDAEMVCKGRETSSILSGWKASKLQGPAKQQDATNPQPVKKRTLLLANRTRHEAIRSDVRESILRLS